MQFIPSDLYHKIHKILPIVCVDIVVRRGDTILLVKRGVEPEKGSWWFPGGRLYRGESSSSAAIRVVKSETGLFLTELCLLGFDETIFEADPFEHGCGTHTINIIYRAIPEGVISLDCNHIEHRWVQYERILVSNYHKYVKKFVVLSEYR